MKKQTMVLSLVAMVMILVGCSKPSINGTWQAKNADVKRIIGNSFTDENLKAKNATLEMVITDATIVNNMELQMESESDGVKYAWDMSGNITYTYTREGDLVKLTYVSHKYDIKDVTLDPEVEEALIANGMTKADFIKEMQKEINGTDDESMKKDESFIIKSIEQNKLTIEDTDGITEYVRIR